MPILVSVNTCNNGSTGQIMRNISKYAAENGYRSFCAYGRGNMATIDSDTDIIIGNTIDVYHHALYARITNRNGFGSTHATEKLVERLKIIQPDVIHLHNLHGYYLNIKILFEYLKESGIPVVWTLHDCWSFTGHCGHFAEAGCEKWRSGCGDCPQTHSTGSRGLVDTSKSNLADKKHLVLALPAEQLQIVTPSQWLANLAEQTYLGKYNISVINNGIDTSVFKPTPSNLRRDNGLENKKIILGVASTWEQQKGLQDFIELSKIIPEDIRIVLIGLNRKQIAKIPANIIGLPRTDSLNELAEWYTTADIYINASTQEVMGLTTIEALSCGTPVIVYNRTALPEFVRSGVTGFVIEPSATNMMKAVYRILYTRPSAKTYAVERNRFSYEKMSSAYCNLYESLNVKKFVK